jgi:hypothetical protein
MAAMVSAGCGDAPAAKTPPAEIVQAPPNVREARSALNTFIVTIDPLPDPPPLNEMFQVRVRVSDARTPTQPELHATIEVDAVMPEHGHGMNTRPSGAWQGDTYVADGLLFHMPGHWQLWVDVTRQGRTERTRFDLRLP